MPKQISAVALNGQAVFKSTLRSDVGGSVEAIAYALRRHPSSVWKLGQQLYNWLGAIACATRIITNRLNVLIHRLLESFILGHC